MKKTNLTIGLMLSMMLLSACGKNSAPQPETPKNNSFEQGLFTLNIDLKENYNDERYFIARNNLISKLSFGLSRVDSTYRDYSDNCDGSFTDYVENSVTKYYSNDVITEETKIIDTEKAFSISTVEESEMSIVYALTDNRENTVARRSYKSAFGYRFDNLMTMSFDSRLDICTISEYYELADSYGYYGKDSQGRGVYYAQMITKTDMSGYSQTGASKDVSSYEITETAVLFDGDALTGNPVYAYDGYRIVDCFNTSYIECEPHLVCAEYVTSSFTYGKRTEYKEKNKFFEDVQKTNFAGPFNVFLTGYNATLSADEQSFTLNSTTPSSNLYFTNRIDTTKNTDFQNFTGYAYGGNYTLIAGTIYRPTLQCSVGHIEFASDGEPHVVITSVKIDADFKVNSELPEGLVLVKADGSDFIYAKQNTRFGEAYGKYDVTLDADGIGSHKFSMDFTITK